MATQYLKEVHVTEHRAVHYTVVVRVDRDDDDLAETVAREAIDGAAESADGVVEFSQVDQGRDRDQGQYNVYDRGEYEICDECGEPEEYCYCWEPADDEGE